MNRKRKAVRIVTGCVSVICAVVFSLVAYAAHVVPDEIEASQIEDYRHIFGLSFGVFKDAVSVSLPAATPRLLSLFGVIPVKTVYLNARDEKHVTLGGVPFGCVLDLKGVLVVGTSAVSTADGLVDPAADAGIRPGDMILSCNGAELESIADFSECVTDNRGEPVELVYERDGETKTTAILPVYSADENCYKLGLWVRDSEAGVGILSFCDNESGVCVGLGHALKDADTGSGFSIEGGSAFQAQILSVEKGMAGSPGQLSGCIQADQVIGNVIGNEEIGVFFSSSAPMKGKDVAVAGLDEIKCGDASLWVALDGGQPKAYKIRIDRMRFLDSERKHLLLRVVDEELLSLTGGFVQGMSGSPILQNDKLVGVLTHVLIDDPTAGYGILADSLLKQAGSLQENVYQRAS